jgi:outer membrane receptor protein involved in Fe transport
MYGMEVDAQYLITMNDKVSFDVGYQKIEITDRPIISSFNSKDYMALTELPGNPKLKATLAYDHTFLFGSGASLVPRVELRYTGGYYLNQMTQRTVDLGEKPYNYQDAYTVVNIGATLTSADGKYSFSGYIRNLLDTEYKAGVGLNTRELSAISVTPGDPSTFGLMFSIKF